MSRGSPPDPAAERSSWAALAAEAETRRRELLSSAGAARAELPLRAWRQQAHFTAPASDFALLRKAVEIGLGAVPDLLARHAIAPDDVAVALGVEPADVHVVLGADPRPPLVLVDAEDAQAPRPDVAARGRGNAVRAFTALNWGPTLRFYRPNGLDQDACVQDLFGVLAAVARGRDLAAYPIDGIVWPKVERAPELEWVGATLGAIERQLDLPENRLRLQFLVESAAAALHVDELARVALPRLAGIVFGSADYGADVGLPGNDDGRFVCDWARAAIVNAAAAAGVPAIDSMTMAYPVADRALSPADNRARVLARIGDFHADALRGFRLGMTGKWVGHPLQLFAVRLAERTALPQEAIDADVRALEAYARAVATQRGTTIVDGRMADRATDRHARVRLRRAVVARRLDPARGIALGVVTPAEAASLQHP